MLFDLYCADSREADFEALALDYAVRFESSPPVWRARTAPTAAASDSRFDLPGLLSRTNADELAADLAGIAHDVPVTLDFSRVDTVDEGGADATTRLLETCRKQTRTLCLVGVERLLPLLADLLCATQSKPAHWLLLLTLYQLLGQEDDFENTAVDYAVRFEVSPPSWGAARPVESRPVDPRSQASAAPAKRNPHPLHGEITPDNDAALRTLVDQAAVGEVRVDLGEVTRFDYGSVSQLIGVLMDGLGQGKSVTFVGHNALIHELFRVMGIDQLATLEPRLRV
jgi:ABC-type transporter Mla MlaB component